jgi:hypothetical protein
MAKAKPAQAEQATPEVVTQDAPEVTQPATPVAATSEQPTATPDAPAAQTAEVVAPVVTTQTPEAVQTDTAPDVAVAPEVYKREDGVRVTELPGGTIREDY